MIELKKPIDAYRAIPDKYYAFEYLADELYYTEDGGPGLKTLLDLHREVAPHAANLHYYTGLWHSDREEFAAAEKALLEAVRCAGNPEERATCVTEAVWARVDSGRALSAYGEIGPEADTFEQLAGYFAGQEDFEQLSKLIVLREIDDPRDRNVHLWKAVVAHRNGQHDQAVATLEKHRQHIIRKQDQVLLWERTMVHALLDRGQFDEALGIARQSTERDGDPYFEIEVHVARGDVSGAMAAMRICVNEFGLLPQEVYADDRMGPLLKKPEFESFRQAFPRPAPPPAPTDR
jgi:hypothetical protein